MFPILKRKNILVVFMDNIIKRIIRSTISKDALFKLCFRGELNRRGLGRTEDHTEEKASSG